MIQLLQPYRMAQSAVVGKFFKQRKAACRYIKWHQLQNYAVVKLPDGYMALRRSCRLYPSEHVLQKV